MKARMSKKEEKKKKKKKNRAASELAINAPEGRKI
jgi:hypothetical protein